jgi:hypothetical protein
MLQVTNAVRTPSANTPTQTRYHPPMPSKSIAATTCLALLTAVAPSAPVQARGNYTFGLAFTMYPNELTASAVNSCSARFPAMGDELARERTLWLERGKPYFAAKQKFLRDGTSPAYYENLEIDAREALETTLKQFGVGDAAQQKVQCDGLLSLFKSDALFKAIGAVYLVPAAQ